MNTDAIVAASPLPTTGAAYKVDFDVSCGATVGLTITPALADGFRLLPASVTMLVGTTATPVTVSPCRRRSPRPRRSAAPA